MLERIQPKYEIPPFDDRTGDHYWVILCSFHIPNPANKDDFMLDHETLVAAQGPGCYYCEKEWSSWLDKRRCKGPKEDR